MIEPILTRIQIAMAQNDVNTTTASSTLTSQQTNSSITLGNAIFTEHDKATPPKPVVINGTHGRICLYCT